MSQYFLFGLGFLFHLNIIRVFHAWKSCFLHWNAAYELLEMCKLYKIVICFCHPWNTNIINLCHKNHQFIQWTEAERSSVNLMSSLGRPNHWLPCLFSLCSCAVGRGVHPFRVQILHGALEEQVAPPPLPGLSTANGVTPRWQNVQGPFLNETRASPDPLSYMFTPPPQSCLKVDLNVKQSLSVSMGNKCISSV